MSGIPWFTGVTKRIKILFVMLVSDQLPCLTSYWHSKSSWQVQVINCFRQSRWIACTLERWTTIERQCPGGHMFDVLACNYDLFRPITLCFYIYYGFSHRCIVHWRWFCYMIIMSLFLVFIWRGSPIFLYLMLIIILFLWATLGWQQIEAMSWYHVLPMKNLEEKVKAARCVNL